MPKGKPRRFRHKYGVVYRVTCLSTGLIYIGQTRHTYPTTRWRTHIQQAKRGHTTRLHADIREHGETAFEFLPIACVWPRGYIDELEKILIDQYQAIATGYNTNYGQTYRPKPPEPELPLGPEQIARQRQLEAAEDFMESLDWD